jgi:hypothetical protein
MPIQHVDMFCTVGPKCTAAHIAGSRTPQQQCEHRSRRVKRSKIEPETPIRIVYRQKRLDKWISWVSRAIEFWLAELSNLNPACQEMLHDVVMKLAVEIFK